MFFLGLEATSTRRVPLWAYSPVSLPQASSEKPKRPISAMFIFSEEKRKQLQEERPELSESELTRLLARMWNDLSEKKKVGTVPDTTPSLSLLLRWECPAVRGDAACPCPAARGFAHPPGTAAGRWLSPGASQLQRTVTQAPVLAPMGATSYALFS